jgi:hypothetical protein
VAADRGRSLVVSCRSRYIRAASAVGQLPFVVMSGAFLVTAPLPVLLITQDGVVLAGGLAGTGAAGSSPDADRFAGARSGAAGGARSTGGAGEEPRVVLGAVAAADRPGGSASRAVAGSPAGACDRISALGFPARASRAKTRGIETRGTRARGFRTWARGFGVPTAFAMGRSTPSCTDGGMEGRGTEIAGHARVMADPSAGGTPN